MQDHLLISVYPRCWCLLYGSPPAQRLIYPSVCTTLHQCWPLVYAVVHVARPLHPFAWWTSVCVCECRVGVDSEHDGVCTSACLTKSSAVDLTRFLPRTQHWRQRSTFGRPSGCTVLLPQPPGPRVLCQVRSSCAAQRVCVCVCVCVCVWMWPQPPRPHALLAICVLTISWTSIYLQLLCRDHDLK